MLSYDWSRKSTFQKWLMHVTSSLFIVGWMYFSVVSQAKQFLTFPEFGRVLWNIIKEAPWVAAFPVVLIAATLVFGKIPSSRYKHIFYQEWAKIYTGKGKGGGAVCFFVEDIVALQLQESVYTDIPFYILKVRLKSSLKYLGKERVVTVGLQINKSRLQSLLDWAKARQIMFTWEVPEQNQRRS